MTDAHGWRPISEAPRDGTTVILYGRMRENPHLHWHRANVFSGYWDAIDNAWCATGSRFDGPFFDPTHWCPTPKPPDKPFSGPRRTMEKGGFPRADRGGQRADCPPPDKADNPL